MVVELTDAAAAAADRSVVSGDHLSAASAARVFARLRLRLLRNGFRGGSKTVVPAVLGILGSVVVAGGGVAAAIASAPASVTHAAVAATMVAAAVTAVALVGPILLVGADDALSPARLAPFPLTRGQRLAGLTAAAAVSPPLASFALVVVAFSVARCRSLAGAPIVVVAAVALWLFVLVTSRVLVAALARLATTRRGRDLGLALGGLIGATGWLWSRAIALTANIGYERFARAARVLRWTPPGALAHAVVDAGSGSLGPAVAGLALGLAGLAVGAALWWLVLGRAEQLAADATAGGPSRRERRARTDAEAAMNVPSGMFGGVLGALPRTRAGAVAARDLRYIVRDPRQRVGLATLLVLAVVFPLVNTLNGHPAPEATLLGSSSALLGALGALNQVGIEGKALWIDLLSGIDPRTFLKGKNLALVTYLVPLVVVTTTILAAFTHGWTYLPAAVLAGCGMLLAGVAVGNVSSVNAPYPPPEGSNPFATGSSGQGCVTGLLVFAAMLMVGVLSLPIAIALIVLRHHPATCVVVGLAAVAYGTMLWWLGLRVAARRMVGREPELQSAVTPAG